MNPLARAAALRMLRLVPVNPSPPGTVDAADLRTSLSDARAALTLALGGTPDIDGYPSELTVPELVLFEVAS